MRPFRWLFGWPRRKVAAALVAADNYLMLTEACEHGHHNSCFKDWCDCPHHKDSDQ